MTRLKTHYDNLQVARTAGAEVIRAAYRALSQKWHPDKHPDNRREAERVMRIINHAYEVLSDPVKRKEHDEWIARIERDETRGPVDSTASTAASDGMPRVGAGRFEYRSLPEAIRKRLREQLRERAGAWATARIGSVSRNYAWIALLAAGLWMLDELFRAGKWPQGSHVLYLPVLIIGALSIAANASKVIRWHLSPLKCHLVLTPLHVVKTRFDDIWARPIWTLSDLEVSRRARLGGGAKTRLALAFPSGRETLTIGDKREADVFLSALQAYRAKVRAAVAEEDWGYFLEKDEFAGARPRPRGLVRRLLPSKTALLVYPAVLAGVFASSGSALERTSDLPGIDRLLPPALEDAVASLTRRPQPLPANGRERRYHRTISLAPFEIRAHPGDGHYFVKVTDWHSGETVMTVFVREGANVETTLPFGSYRLEYANGAIWYGKEHLFGPETSYGRTDRRLDVFETDEGYAGYTIELVPHTEDPARSGRIGSRRR